MADSSGPSRIEKGPSVYNNTKKNPSVRLSCDECRRRKVKCDKLHPCTNCQRTGATCVPVERARLPRGRSGRKTAQSTPDQESDLGERLSKLEGIIANVAANSNRVPSTGASAPFSKSNSNSSQERPSLGQSPVSGNPGRNAHGDGAAPVPQRHDSYLGTSFWAELLHQIRDIREIETADSNDQFHVNDNILNYGNLVASPTHAQDLDLPRTRTDSYNSTYIKRTLCQTFLERVDPFFKILHRPSLSAFLLDDKPYLDYEPGHHAPTALACAVYYAAACTLSERECNQLFEINQSSLIATYRKECELALVDADVITTNDLTVLQAFVLSLLASHSQDRSRRVWTMLSMALRVAQALYLHVPEPPFPVRPFDREMRKRLWIAIGFLDLHAAMDRATEPMMQASWLQSHPPTNTNDSDLDYRMTNPVLESPGFTDTSYSLMMLEAQCAGRLLNFSDFLEPVVKSMPIRQQLVMNFQQIAWNFLQHATPSTNPFHWFAYQVAECTYASMQLNCLRPIQRIANFTPPHVQGDRLLTIAVSVLTKMHSILTDPRSRPWHWIEYMFVPWHGLAVAIAELCVCDDPSLFQRYWDPVEQAYERLGGLVADSRKGMLWKPMEKIMAQARLKRQEVLGSNHSFQITNPVAPTFSNQNAQNLVSSAQVQGQIPTPPIDATEPFFAGPASTDIENMGIDPWLSVWDAIENGAGAGTIEGGNDVSMSMSWLNYENFIDDVYGNLDWSLIPH